MKTLNNINIGQRAVILSVETEGGLKQRLYDIGLLPGTVVKVLHKSPAGDPRAYLIKGSVIALRNSDTERIFAEVVGDG